MGPVLLFTKSGNSTQKGTVYPLTPILGDIFIFYINILHSQMTQALTTAPLPLISQKLRNLHSITGKSGLVSFLSNVLSGVQEGCLAQIT